MEMFPHHLENNDMTLSFQFSSSLLESVVVVRLVSSDAVGQSPAIEI